MQKKQKKHYVRVRFGLTKDNSPAIYDFFWKHLGGALKAAGAKEALLDIERLEPVTKIYTNINTPDKEAEKTLHKFARSHHLKEHASLTFYRHKTSLRARVNVAKLSALLKDYNLLFDLFFADLVLKSPQLTIDMMDGFSNSLLVFGEEQAVHNFQKFVREKMPGTKFEFADSPVKGKKMKGRKAKKGRKKKQAGGKARKNKKRAKKAGRGKKAQTRRRKKTRKKAK